jgi:fucose 4-O-acetylase-like acetyltransferase
LRGFFLFVIIIDHIELYPGFFDFFAGRGRLWVSAAEGFFFISGLLVGYIYRRKLAKGFRFIWTKMWKRAAMLYGVSIVLTLLFTVAAIGFGRPDIKYGLPATIDWPKLIVDTLTLRYSFGWADFLPHYVIFMLWAPLSFFLLMKRLWWLLLLLMAGIWLVRGQNFEMAWQILFMGGMMVGYYWQSLIGWTARWPKRRQIVVRRGIYVLAGVTFIMSYLSVFVLSELNAQLAALPGWLASITQQWDTLNTATWPFFEKWTLEPGRIIVFGLWFMAGYLFLSRHYKAIPRFIEQAFVLLGQNSLFVYGLHSVVIFMLHLIVRQSYVWWINAFISLGVLMIIISVTTIYKGKMSFTVRGLPRFDRPRVDI